MSAREIIRGIPVERLQAPEGQEVEFFNAHMDAIAELTKGKTNTLSCSGFNARTMGERELSRGIGKAIDRIRDEHARAVANPAKPGQGGGVRYLPSLVIIQNYGWGIYCDLSSGVIEA